MKIANCNLGLNCAFHSFCYFTVDLLFHMHMPCRRTRKLVYSTAEELELAMVVHVLPCTCWARIGAHNQLAIYVYMPKHQNNCKEYINWLRVVNRSMHALINHTKDINFCKINHWVDSHVTWNRSPLTSHYIPHEWSCNKWRWGNEHNYCCNANWRNLILIAAAHLQSLHIATIIQLYVFIMEKN